MIGRDLTHGSSTVHVNAFTTRPKDWLGKNGRRLNLEATEFKVWNSDPVFVNVIERGRSAVEVGRHFALVRLRCVFNIISLIGHYAGIVTVLVSHRVGMAGL